MSGLYEDFEKRFTNAWFSASWGEVEVKPTEKVAAIAHKDLETLESELVQIKDTIENIKSKQDRLANLAKFYNNSFEQI